MAFELDNEFDSGVDIRVVGVGGGGNNAVNRMISSNVKGVQFIAINTDRPALLKSSAATKICIGEETTKGNGAGANPEVGLRAAEESVEQLKEALSGADMVFIATGMGGGTGTGAAPVVARLSKEMGILTVAIVTKPFKFEGPRRMNQADAGITELSKHVDALVVIPNERLKEVTEEKITLMNAFAIADDVLKRGVQSISDLINNVGFINLDFADVTAIVKNAGLAHMGMGEGKGPNKAIDAAKMAIESPLLETSIKGAHGIIINITVPQEVGLDEVSEASAMITDEAAPDANIIWGATFDDTLEDSMKITIIATGFDKLPNKNVKIDAESVDDIPLKRGTEIKEDDCADIIDMINKARKGNTETPFGGKKY